MLNLRTGYTVADASICSTRASSGTTWLSVDVTCTPSLFREGVGRSDARAALPIAGYKKLYEIEAEIRDKDETPSGRRDRRGARRFRRHRRMVPGLSAERATIVGLGKAIQSL